MSFGELNWINVGPDGTFRASGDHHTTQKQVDDIFSHLNQLENKKLVIHLHGGLVNELDGMETAKLMEPVYSDAQAHALTFVWETGFWETLKDDWLDIAKDSKLLQKVMSYAAEKVLGTVVPGLAKGPGSKTKGKEVASDPSLASQYDKDVAAYCDGISDAELIGFRDAVAMELELETVDDVELKELLDDGEVTRKKGLASIRFAWFVAKIAYRVFKRTRAGTDHGWYASLIEEALHELGVASIGKSVWDSMKNKSLTMWADSPAGASFEEMNAGNVFLRKLNELMNAHPDFTVDVVGHSAGAIACMNMLNAIDELGLGHIKIRNVAFLAPAARMEMFDEAIINASSRFESFRMFTMRDELEAEDTLVGDWDVLYPRSLLYFISGVLEGGTDEALIGLERHFSGRSPYNLDDGLHIRCRDFLINHPASSLVLSEANGSPGLECEAKDHGLFDNDPKTRKSLTIYCS